MSLEFLFSAIRIVNDDIGNPLTYDGYTFTWEMGRPLKSLTGNGKTISYKYNDAGIRTSKTINGVTTKYILNGDSVIYEDNGTDKIHYSYGGSGLIGFNLNGVDEQRTKILILCESLSSTV